MRRHHALSLIIFSVLLITGCSTNFVKIRDVPPEYVAFTDIKQRALVRFGNFKNKDDKITYMRFCAEPFPDALSAIAANTNINIESPKEGTLGLNNAFTESAAFIGNRTTAIQSLRDVMYRNCEAFGNGAIDRAAFTKLMVRFQSSMMAIIAIEQLTGAVKPPATVITNNVSSGDANSIIKLTEQSAALKNKIEAGKKAVAEAKTKKDTADKAKTPIDEYLAENKKAYDEAKKKNSDSQSGPEKELISAYEAKRAELIPLAEQAEQTNTAFELATEDLENNKAALTVIEQARKAALTSGGTANASVEFESQPAKNLTGVQIAALGNTIRNIVKDQADHFFGQDVCEDLLTKNGNTAIPPNSPLLLCLQLIVNKSGSKATVSSTKHIDNLTTKLNSRLSNKSSLDREEVKGFLNLWEISPNSGSMVANEPKTANTPN